MLKHKKLLLPLLLLLAMPGASIAADRADTYVAVGYHWGKYKNDNNIKSDPSAIQLIVGQYVLPIVAIEGRIGKGVGSADIKLSDVNTGVDMEVDRYASLLARVDLPLPNGVFLYGLAGYTEGRLEASALGYSITDKDSGPSYGVGIEINGDANSYLSAEYIQYLDETDGGVDYEYNGFNVNLGVRF